MTGAHPLDNAVHATLTGVHAHVADVHGTATRYQRDVNVFYGVERCDATGWHDLAELAGPGAVVVLFRAVVPPAPEGWEVVLRGVGRQMLLEDTTPVVAATASAGLRGLEVRELGGDHAADMLALATATRPGPFLRRTHELGRFVGVFDRAGDGDRLVAMAGERLHVDGHHEISAVCTDPEARGRGLAALLTAHVARRILADGDRPMLHVASDNHGAQRVYERLGFATRRMVDFHALRTPR